MDEMYGIGVHSYFSGNLPQAESIFTQLIDSGSEDPRVFYFRGITQTKLAGDTAGKADFDKAANLEMQGKRNVDVGKALQRIQGTVRMEIEKSRSAARLTYATKRMLLEKTRIEKLPKTSGSTPKDPFGDDAAPTQGQPQAMPTPTTPEAPAAEISEPGTDAPAGADPFDTPSSDAPAADAPAAEEGADPFGGDPAPEGGTTPPAADEDPFG
jgi:hypothetical protein